MFIKKKHVVLERTSLVHSDKFLRPAVQLLLIDACNLSQLATRLTVASYSCKQTLASPIRIIVCSIVLPNLWIRNIYSLYYQHTVLAPARQNKRTKSNKWEKFDCRCFCFSRSEWCSLFELLLSSDALSDKIKAKRANRRRNAANVSLAACVALTMLCRFGC